MGVDVSAYTLYGAELNEPYWFVTESDYGIDVEGNYKIVDTDSDELPYNKLFVISDKICNKYKAEIIFDHYSCDYQFIGLHYLDKTVEDTIDNLSKIKENWTNLLIDLELEPEKYVADLICDYYYW